MHPFQTLLGQSDSLQSVLNAAQMVAMTDVTLLVTGESGTGKELLAQAIHQASPRANGPMVTINCAALPEALVESELFGHRKGSFTGASEHAKGRIQAAEGGTVFLDEIGELPLPIQAKLLRFLESGECQAVGETAPRKVNVRVVAATNRDLFQEAQAGNFREDLFYRLNVVPLELPPLRERHGDIVLLAKELLQQAATRHQLPAAKFSKCALKALQSQAWPGNVRELRNLCERLAILLAGQTIEATNLPLTNSHTKTMQAGFRLPEEGFNLETMEVDMIQQALQKTAGNRSRAARLLGLSRDTLLYRMKKHAIV